MPITQAAKKAVRQSERRRVLNTNRKRDYRMAVRQTRELLGENKIAEAREAFVAATKAIDKATKRSVLHKNTAGRMKSQLAKALHIAEQGGEKKPAKKKAAVKKTKAKKKAAPKKKAAKKTTAKKKAAKKK